jgi:singapore isolate B (sub-type 7) whole genome shotgun sequence assembly, scaffold_1
VGRVERTSVSGKTNYLVAGFEMEDGRKITQGAQYKAAIQKKVKIISDLDLMKMVANSIEKKESE